MDMSANASMNDWTRSGWFLHPSHGYGIIEAPPPRAADEFIPLTTPPQTLGEDVQQVSKPDDYLDFVEDLLTAEEAEIEYDAYGTKGSISYMDYRNKRLGPKS